MSDALQPEESRPAAPTRDRRDDGRPEQARPRDRTGRPLPYDTTGVPLIEEHAPDTVEEALGLGIELWREERFFEAHECLEHVWHAAPAEDADLWQGVIQIAVAGVHLQRGNLAGARSLLTRASERLTSYPDGHRGIAVSDAVARCRALVSALDGDRSPAASQVGGFPAAAGGAWFSPTVAATRPPGAPTPLPAQPAAEPGTTTLERKMPRD